MTLQAPGDDRLSGTTRVRAPLPGKHGTRHRLPSEPGPAEGSRTKEAAGPIVQLVRRVTSDARLVSVARITCDGRVTSGPLVVLTGVLTLAVYVTDRPGIRRAARSMCLLGSRSKPSPRRVDACPDIDHGRLDPRSR